MSPVAAPIAAFSPVDTIPPGCQSSGHAVLFAYTGAARHTSAIVTHAVGDQYFDISAGVEVLSEQRIQELTDMPFLTRRDDENIVEPQHNVFGTPGHQLCQIHRDLGRTAGSGL